MNSSENFGSSWSARTIAALSNRIIWDIVIAVTAPGGAADRSSSPHQRIPPFHGERPRLPYPLGNHGDLAVAVHHVKDSIRRISPAKDHFILSIFRFRPSPVSMQ